MTGPVIGMSFSILLFSGCSGEGGVGGPGGGAEGSHVVSCAADDAHCRATTKAGVGPSPDGEKNGRETDVDCGGADEGTARCDDGKGCLAGTDCESQVCIEGVCQPPAPDDGVKNGDETDVDCGGTKARPCAAGKGCAQHSDCASDGCAYNGTCVAVRSCTGHSGGDTCGAGEVGDPGAKHESCCERAPVSTAPDATLLDKYVITAGRMRQFIERHDGNLRAFGETLGDNPNWRPEWTRMLPASLGEAHFLLGPTGHGSDPARRGCDLGDSRARTYWMSPEENAAIGEERTHAFDKDTLDQKALNCVEFYMLQALCIWDGGRLATYSELQEAWRGGEDRAYPWGNRFDIANVVHEYSYSFPEIYDQGNFVFVAAPGRRPGGYGKFGHADLAGLVLNMTSTVSGNKITWLAAGSWEKHEVTARAAKVETDISRAYWAVGGRCALPR